MAPSAISTREQVDLTAAATSPKGTNQSVPSSEAPLDASKLTYTYTTNPRAVPEASVATSGLETVATDHMITAKWHLTTGWSAPELKPYGPLSVMPTASVLHYATECFEGMKVYRGFDGKLRLFRPNLNAKRMRISAGRIALPLFEPDELEKLMVALLSVDGAKWLPKDKPGTFLYIRPTMIGTQPQLGVQAPKEALLYVIVTFLSKLDTPVGGMRLHTSPEDMVRAWVGGFGYAKLGANYGPSLVATSEARKRGFHQVLWLYGQQQECTEAGASNFMVLWKRKDGKKELVTAPLDDKLILDGITRRSVLELVRERLAGEIEVTERKFTIDEVLEADGQGRMLEAFVCGTAYFVCAVSQIHHRGQDVHIPIGQDSSPAEITKKIKGWMSDIVFGNENGNKWAVVIDEKEKRV